jgi:flagellar hook protein FlgE
MSLYGMMRTGGSGMNAQANRLSTVADNIANTGTTGYKAASTEFSSLLLPSQSGNYNSGAVSTTVRNNISEQGALTYTSSPTDLAINGNGFFVVEDTNGATFLTRAGGFVPNAEGELVNSAGYKLLGYPSTNGSATSVVNGFNGLEPITVGTTGLTASATSEVVFSANLDSGEEVLADSLPADNAADSETTHKTSLKVYDSLGNEVLLDIYYAKTDDNTWTMSVYNAAGRDEDTGSFPYADSSLLDADMTFDPSTGKLETPEDAVFTLDADFLPNMPEMTIDMSEMTQFSYDFTPGEATVNGNAPSEVSSVQIANDGTVYAQYANGDLVEISKLAIANVESPDNLRVLSGNVFAVGVESGVVSIGFAGNSGLGEVVSGALESSTVDLAEELTNMIESQRTYTANSKVFQTGSDLMDVLINLKR